MSYSNILTILDAAAGDLVTADYDCVQDIIALCGSIEKVRDAVLEAGYARIPEALNRAVELINVIATDDSCDRTAVIEALNKIFSAVQHALRPGFDPEKLKLPSSLMQDIAAHVCRTEPDAERPFYLPDYLDREIFTEFINDQDSVLAGLEAHLLSLERRSDLEALADVKRLFHTLKGEAGVFELRQVERLCHATEDIIEAQPDALPVDILLAVKDWLKLCFDALKVDRPVPPFPSEVLGIIVHESATEEGSTALTADAAGRFAKKFELSPFIAPEIFEIFIDEQEHALEMMDEYITQFESGPDLEAVAGLKRIFHTLNGGSGVCGLADIERVCCHVEDAIDKHPNLLSPSGLHGIRQWLKTAFNALHADEPLPVLSDMLLKNTLRDSAETGAAQDMPALKSGVEDEVFNDFVDELQSISATVEALVLKLERHHDNATVDELKRIFHTLKGEARVFGLADIEKLCHAMEDMLEQHAEQLPFDTLFGVNDFLARCFRSLKNSTAMPELTPLMLNTLLPLDIDNDSSTAAVVYNPLKGPVSFKLQSDDTQSPTLARPDPFDASHNVISADLDLLSDFVSEVKEHIDNIDNRLLSLENNPGDSDLLNAVFRVFHTIKGAAGFLALDEISRLAHVTESLLDSARKGDRLLEGVSIDLIFEAVDEMKNLVGIIEDTISSGDATYPSSITVDLLVEKIKQVLSGPHISPHPAPVAPSLHTDSAPPPVFDSAVVQAAAEEKLPGTASARTADTEVEEDTCIDADYFFENSDNGQCDNLSDFDQEPGRQPAVQHRIKIKETIKVDAENLDKLIDAIGELVIIEAMVRQDASVRSVASSTLLRNVTQMDKITRELQTLGMSLRMIPIKPTFQKMARVVRDLAKKSGKKIEFVTQGEDTMLDKSVVDRIGDPLIHLVRNAVDHGIEVTHEDRRRLGKSPVGQIALTAFHKGGNIYVEIKDDGRGLNRSAIQNKAIERGIIREGHQLGDREIFNLILLPGFSTAGKVTDVSGRGVGMDVVKRTIEDLRGNIDITSNSGIGTTISLRLPLTLAIIDGMLVRVGGERYIVPTLSIVESVRPRIEDVTTVVNKAEMIRLRDKLIPLFRLADLFGIRGAAEHINDSIVIVVEDSGRMAGIMVDELLGQQSTVIKSLGALKGLTGISGGSIMTDGSVGIILDIAGIVKLAAGNTGIERSV